MSSFIDTLKLGVEEYRGADTDIFLDESVLEIFREYGTFLDAITDDKANAMNLEDFFVNSEDTYKRQTMKGIVAHSIIQKIREYNADLKRYNIHDDVNYELSQLQDTLISNEIQNNKINEEEEPLKSNIIATIRKHAEGEHPLAIRKKNDVSNAIKADLTKAKNFRLTLKSREEKYDMFIRNIHELYPEGSKEYNHYLEASKRILTTQETPYETMVNLIDDYIDDLENKTFKMAKKEGYIASYPKPNFQELQKYLIKVCRSLDIKGVNDAKRLIIALNGLSGDTLVSSR